MRQDRRCDLFQIIVELMVAAPQAMDTGLRNRACVEVDVRGWRDFILKPVIEMDGTPLGSRAPRSGGNCRSSADQPPSPTKGAAIKKIAPNSGPMIAPRAL